MQERISPTRAYQLQPELPKALLSLSEAAEKSGLEASLIHLLKVRASQINRCAFCLNMHNKEARRAGEDQQRLDVLAAWREVSCFSEPERAALAWCEALTLLADGPVSDLLHRELAKQFDEKEIINLTAIVVVINSWNRIVAAMRFIPAINSEEKEHEDD